MVIIVYLWYIQNGAPKLLLMAQPLKHLQSESVKFGRWLGDRKDIRLVKKSRNSNPLRSLFGRPLWTQSDLEWSLQEIVRLNRTQKPKVVVSSHCMTLRVLEGQRRSKSQLECGLTCLWIPFSIFFSRLSIHFSCFDFVYVIILHNSHTGNAQRSLLLVRQRTVLPGGPDHAVGCCNCQTWSQICRIQYSCRATNHIVARRPVLCGSWPTCMEQTSPTASSRLFCCYFQTST